MNPSLWESLELSVNNIDLDVDPALSRTGHERPELIAKGDILHFHYAPQESGRYHNPSSLYRLLLAALTLFGIPAMGDKRSN